MARWHQWPEYISVAERRARAARALRKLKKKGTDAKPIEPFSGRKIAHSFWGKAWCTHLKTYSDYANRLPRGRSYLRHGQVCHLEIEPGEIIAEVSGSYLYKVKVSVDPLSKKAWRRIKKACAGEIGSLLELLQGHFSDQVMAIVADPARGLFPQADELHLGCSCPDGAYMCKHIAAALYGVGRRLDDEPDLLFYLRDVDPHDLLDADLDIPTDDITPDEAAHIIEGAQLGDLFDIDFDDDFDLAPPEEPSDEPHEAPPKAIKKKSEKKNSKSEKRASKSTKKKATKKKAAKKRKPKTKKTSATHANDDFAPTGPEIKTLREMFDYTAEEFGEQVGVSEATVYRWERTKGPVKLQPEPKRKLKLLF